MIELLKQLINIPSVTGNETAITDFIEGYLKACQGSVKRHGKNLIWTCPEYDPAKETIALIGHSDTVPWDEHNWKITQPTAAKEVDGKVYGRGACDMKGGVSVILDLIKTLVFPLPVNVVGIIYHGEEGPLPNGITEVLAANILPKIDRAIVLEPTDGYIVNGVFSCLSLTVKATGKAAHSSRPELGANAIYTLSKCIQNLQKTPLRTIQKIKEALSVTMISGGSAANIIPESAQLTLNFRCDPGLSKQEVLDRLPIQNLSIIDIDWSTGGLANPEPFSALGNAKVEPYWTDIAQLIQHGIPAVNFGPGSMEQAHQADEFVSIKSLLDTKITIHSYLEQSTKNIKSSIF